MSLVACAGYASYSGMISSGCFASGESAFFWTVAASTRLTKT